MDTRDQLTGQSSTDLASSPGTYELIIAERGPGNKTVASSAQNRAVPIRLQLAYCLVLCDVHITAIQKLHHTRNHR